MRVWHSAGGNSDSRLLVISSRFGDRNQRYERHLGIHRLQNICKLIYIIYYKLKMVRGIYNSRGGRIYGAFVYGNVFIVQSKICAHSLVDAVS